MGRLFGTDGVRGTANADLTAELALDLAVAAAHVLGERVELGASARPTAVVGRDPRASGEFLEAAVVAGLASAGVDVVRLGVLPTPAVAYLTGALGADLGVVLSASHNPMPDNGIKLFSRDGFKLPDPVEDEIAGRVGEPWQRPTAAAVGRVRDDTAAVRRYVGHLLEALPGSLAGLRVVVDCANGAASLIGPEVLRAAGASVVALAADPDGVNINDGVGSTHPEHVARVVVETTADAGIAYDGDADRCIAIDATGQLVDGDAILAICALAAQRDGRLPGDAVATTVMTNLGFKQAMAAHGIRVVQTPVGDRYVLEAMLREGICLGGEQSGHLVFFDHATTGDGILTSLHLLAQVAMSRRPLAELAGVMRRLPQVLLNVTVTDRETAAGSAGLAAVVAEIEEELGDTGRVLVRPSGTEPVVRIMVEADSSEQARRCAERIAAAVV